jgi:predicted ATPase
MHGWALAEMGQPSEGVKQIRENLAAWLVTRAKFYVPYFRAMLAEAYGRQNRPKAERLAQLQKAILQADRTNWRPFEAELFRQRGSVLASGMGADLVAGEADFRRAIVCARGLGAKLWELRAATSLAFNLRDRGARSEARDILAPIYGWFAEGMDTPALAEAKALLESVQ